MGKHALIWATLGLMGGAFLGATGRAIHPDLGGSFGPRSDAVIAGIVWLTVGAVVGTILDTRQVDTSSLWRVGGSVLGTVVVAILWAIVPAFGWLLIGAFFSVFLDTILRGSIFSVILLPSLYAISAVVYGAAFWAVVVLIQWAFRRGPP